MIATVEAMRISMLISASVPLAVNAHELVLREVDERRRVHFPQRREVELRKSAAELLGCDAVAVGLDPKPAVGRGDAAGIRDGTGFRAHASHTKVRSFGGGGSSRQEGPIGVRHALGLHLAPWGRPPHPDLKAALGTASRLEVVAGDLQLGTIVLQVPVEVEPILRVHSAKDARQDEGDGGARGAHCAVWLKKRAASARLPNGGLPTVRIRPRRCSSVGA